MRCAERIRALREDNDLNQTQIAKMLYIGQATYSNYENGKVSVPLEHLIKLAEFYNVDMNYITGISGIKQNFPTK